MNWLRVFEIATGFAEVLRTLSDGRIESVVMKVRAPTGELSDVQLLEGVRSRALANKARWEAARPPVGGD